MDRADVGVRHRCFGVPLKDFRCLFSLGAKCTQMSKQDRDDGKFSPSTIHQSNLLKIFCLHCMFTQSFAQKSQSVLCMYMMTLRRCIAACRNNCPTC